MTSSDFPLLPGHLRILETAKRCPGRGKHCARNAVHHLQRAWLIRQIDPTMAVFRAITAEEEAASAIFYALVRHRYPGAARLLHTSHEQKAAVRPFLQAILQFIAESPVEQPTITLGPAKKPRAETRFAFTALTGERYWFLPQPPLHFAVRHNGSEEGLVFILDDLLLKLASRNQFSSIAKYIEHAKNERNRLLYAGDRGYPDIVDLRDEYFFDIRQTIFRHLLVYLLIDQYRTHQNFVQQALTIFLRLIQSKRGSRVRS